MIVKMLTESNKLTTGLGLSNLADVVRILLGCILVPLGCDEERNNLIGGQIVRFNTVVLRLARCEALLPLDSHGGAQGVTIEEIDEENVAGFDWSRHFWWWDGWK